MIELFDLSERRACRLVGLSRDSYLRLNSHSSTVWQRAVTLFHQPSKSINLEQDLLLLNGMANVGRSVGRRRQSLLRLATRLGSECAGALPAGGFAGLQQ
jgi:hypothetical protein